VKELKENYFLSILLYFSERKTLFLNSLLRVVKELKILKVIIELEELKVLKLTKGNLVSMMSLTSGIVYWL